MHWRRRFKYVPIINRDGRTDAEKWQDPEYLRLVGGLANNQPFVSEVVGALLKLRDEADKAKNPDVLLGMQAGIMALKALLTAPQRAKDRLEVMSVSRAIN